MIQQTTGYTNKLAVFDFDGTITSRDSFNDIIIWKFGFFRFLIRMISLAPLIFLYKIGVVDNAVPKCRMFKSFFKGMKEEDFFKICETYSLTRIDPIVRKQTRELIERHREMGHRLIIVSASLESWIYPWARKNSFEEVIASKPEIVNGLLTGSFMGENCYGIEKTNRLQQRFPKRFDYFIYAYGDSEGDRELIKYADQGIYINRKARTNSSRIKVIITDGLWRKSISVIRSLGRAGCEINVMGDSLFTTGFWSRYTSRRIVAPTAEHNEEDFGQKLMDLILQSKGKQKPVLFPMEDATLMWVVNNYDEVIKYANVLLPSKKALEVAEDKAATIKLAKSLGLPVPETWEPSNVDELEKIIQESRCSEVVIKPRTGSGSVGIVYAKLGDKINYRSHWEKYGPLIIQERINVKGRGIGVSLLMDKDGDCVAHFEHERIRQYPISGGPSTDRISIHAPQLVKLSIKLLRGLSWRGVAMVEWKEDPADGIPKLMEINPRFWGSLELAVRAGVDFPYLYTQAVLGQVSKISPSYEEGVRCRWLIPGDILRYLGEEKQNREGFRCFIKGLPSEAEEWDRQDIRGSLACAICPALLVLNPYYWKYLKRTQ